LNVEHIIPCTAMVQVPDDTGQRTQVPRFWRSKRSYKLLPYYSTDLKTWTLATTWFWLN
jgi:hypothetical protein